MKVLNVTSGGFTSAALVAAIKKAGLTSTTDATGEELLKLKSFATSDGKMVIDLVTTGEEAALARVLLDTPRKATKALVANVNAEGVKAFSYDKATKTKVPVDGVEATHYKASSPYATKIAVDPAEKKAANAQCAVSKKMQARKDAAKQAKATKARKTLWGSRLRKGGAIAATIAIAGLTYVLGRKVA